MTLLESADGLVELFERSILAEHEHVVPRQCDIFREACVLFIKAATWLDDIDCIVQKTVHQLVYVISKIWTTMFSTLLRSQGSIDVRCKLA